MSIKRAKGFSSPRHIDLPSFRALMPQSQVDLLSTKEQAKRRQKALSDSQSHIKEADKLMIQVQPVREALSKLQVENAKLETRKDIQSQTLLTTNLQTIERLANEIEPLRSRAARLRTKARESEKIIPDDLVKEMEALRNWSEAGISMLTELQAEANNVLAWKADELKGKLRKGIFEEDDLKTYANIWAVINSKKGKRLAKNGAPEERRKFLMEEGWMDSSGRPLSTGRVSEVYEIQVLEWVTGEPSTGTKEMPSSKKQESSQYAGGIQEVDMTGIDPYGKS